MNNKTVAVMASLAFAALSVACTKQPAAPFNTFKDAQITVYRLQNFEVPAQTAATTTPTLPTIPGLPNLFPPEVQAWATQGAAGMCALIPPGFPTPPGCPAAGTTAATTTTTTQDARFEGSRILGQNQVMDAKLHEEIINILGFSENFGTNKSQCMYPELGISFAQPPQAPANVLVSFSCKQVQARNFAWPHANNGLNDDTVRRFSDVVQKLFGGS
jgi:hypothetical protein